MTGKKNSLPAAQVGYIGYCEWAAPATSSSSSSSSKAVVSSGGGKRNWTDAFESQNTSKAVYKGPGGGSTAKFTKTEKAGGFVDRRSGNHGYKQEVNYKTSMKVSDQAQGSTTEYEAQVKFKKTTTYHAPKKTSAAAAAPKTSSVYRCVTYYDDDDY